MRVVRITTAHKSFHTCSCFSCAREKNPCAEAHNKPHQGWTCNLIPQSGGKSQPGEGRKLLESFLLLHGVLVEHHALGKVTAQLRSSLGASVDFPPHKNRFTTDNLHYQPHYQQGAAARQAHTSVPQLIQQLLVWLRKAFTALITLLFVIYS